MVLTLSFLAAAAVIGTGYVLGRTHDWDQAVGIAGALWFVASNPVTMSLLDMDALIGPAFLMFLAAASGWVIGRLDFHQREAARSHGGPQPK